LPFAAEHIGNLAITDYFREAGADIKAYNVYGTNSLYIRVAFNKNVLALNLIEKGSDVKTVYLESNYFILRCT